MRNRARLGLKKPRFRQSWNKYNLYAFSRLTTPSYKARTFFQQKWTAKSVLRMYHSEQVGEHAWEKMFNSRLKAVIPMDPAYLARNDGSIESAGRGSGLEKASNAKKSQHIPYMATTFAPLERRLDTAVFRSLFASSARQARQFVVHGSVKVNGKLMRHPGYLLNPGDMFQVDPEMVMFATGAKKEIESSSSEDSGEKATPVVDTASAEKDAEDPAKEEETKISEGIEEDASEEDSRDVLRSLLGQAKFILSKSKNPDLSARRKVALRGFSAQVKRQLSRSTSSTILTDSLEAQFAELKAQLTGKAVLPATAETDDSEAAPTTSKTNSSDYSTPFSSSSSSSTASADPAAQEAIEDAATELMTIHDALAMLRDNPIDSSKPYATPWTPKPYMSAFAFIPRYLEVNQNICAAVYLRHPVARPGMSEVPSPFPEATQGEAYIWYLRRR